jgi:ABC-type branched-subunit amino acid transport system permease subunit
LAAIPALLASWGEGSQDSPGDKGLLDRLSLKAWYGVTVLAAAAYLWTGLAGASVLGLAAAAALGAMTTVNRTKCMASYLSRLKHERHADVIATLNSLSVAASLLPFAVISAGKVLGFAIGATLLGVVAAASVLLGLSWLMARQPEGKK